MDFLVTATIQPFFSHPEFQTLLPKLNIIFKDLKRPQFYPYSVYYIHIDISNAS
jgi:hypothetical protein